MTTVERELQEMRREMADALSERKRCRDLKVVMRRLLATEAAVEKVETMLQIANTNDGGDGDAQTRQTRPRPVDAEYGFPFFRGTPLRRFPELTSNGDPCAGRSTRQRIASIG